jgi:hypothetical protein
LIKEEAEKPLEEVSSVDITDDMSKFVKKKKTTRKKKDGNTK